MAKRKPYSKLRIKVTLLVTVDRAHYEAEFGVNEGRTEIRDWVAGEAQSALQSAIGHVPETDVEVVGSTIWRPR